MISKLILPLLRRFPVLYAAARGASAHRAISRPAVLTPLGFKMCGLNAMESGSFEPDETRQISALLREVTALVNIGANTGYYVCLARNAGAKVLAIEPLDQNVQILQRNILANGWNDVEIFPVGLGDRVDVMKLYGGGTAASLVEGWAGAAREHYRLVPVSTLDNVLGDRFAGEKILILMDVEGFELNVLRGALRQFTRKPAPVWFIEICIDEHQPSGVRINPNLVGTFEIFWRHGYHAEKAGSESGAVSEADVRAWAAGNQLPKTHNFIFRRAD